MRLIVHDLSEEAFSALGLPDSDTAVIAANGKYAPCAGCYKCWAKTPGVCRIRDGLQHAGALFGKAGEVIIISENWYGGYSADVKNVFDRSISISLPFFTYRGGKLHHRRRYGNVCDMKVYLYGDATEAEKETAAALVEANRHNSGYRSTEVHFVDRPENIRGLFA